MNNICPDCDRPLYKNACPCGWKEPAPARVYVPPQPAPYKPKAPGTSWRERWYAERGLPYEPPRLIDVPGWQCVGRATNKVTPQRQREPGDDDDEVAA